MREEELREDFEANMLDGDAVQEGQMLSSESVLNYIKGLVTTSNKQVLEQLKEKAPKSWSMDGYSSNGGRGLQIMAHNDAVEGMHQAIKEIEDTL